jgi:hypothetical protein
LVISVAIADIKLSGSRYGFPGSALLNIEACPTPTTALCSRIARDLELTSNQFRGVIDRTSFQQLQRGRVHDYLRMPFAPIFS